MSPNSDQTPPQKSQTNSQTLSTTSIDKLCKEVHYPSFSDNRKSTDNASPSRSSTPTPSPISSQDSSPSFVGAHETAPHSDVKLASNYHTDSRYRNGVPTTNQSDLHSTRDSTANVNQSHLTLEKNNNNLSTNMRPDNNFPVPLGLQNLGNTCYINSAIQVIYHIPSLRNNILTWDPHSINQNEITDDLQFAWDLTVELQRLFVSLEQQNFVPSLREKSNASSDRKSISKVDSNGTTSLPSRNLLQKGNGVQSQTPVEERRNNGAQSTNQQRSKSSSDRVPDSPSSNLSDDTDSIDHYLEQTNNSVDKSVPRKISTLPESVYEDDLDKTYNTRLFPREYDYVSPHEIVNLLRDQDRCIDFDARGQQDAHEFLRYLLDKVDVCLKACKKPISSNIRRKEVLQNQTDETKPNLSIGSKPDANVCQPSQIGALTEKSEANSSNQSSNPDKPKKSELDSQTGVKTKRARDWESDEETQGSRKEGKRYQHSSPVFGKNDAETAGTSQISNPDNHELKPVMKLKKRARHNIIPGLFEGKSTMTTRCCTCETQSNRMEAFMDVALPVEAGRSLEWTLSSQGIPEELQGSNKYYCEFCNTYCEAQRWWRLAALPDVLTIQLKLFAFDVPHRSSGGKVSVAMSCPLQMKFKEWCSEDCEEKDDEYKLTGIIVHEGSAASSGHYYSYIYKSDYNQWFCFDDSMVSQVSENDLKDLFSAMSSCRTAYMLFYTRFSS